MAYTLNDFESILNLTLVELEERLKKERTLTQVTAEENKTLLHHLMKKNSDISQCKEKAELLIKYGSNLKAVDYLGRSPLHTGLQYGIQPPVLESLIKAAKKQNYNFNQKDTNGNTPLILSISVPYHYTNLGWARVVDTHTARLLEINELDPNLPNNASLSPLFIALQSSLTKDVVRLVRSGADPEKIDNVKFTDGTNEKISVIQHITRNINKHEQRGDTKAASDLANLKDQIILSRLLFLVEDKLKDYEDSRKGIFRTSADSQRLQLISQIRDHISAIQIGKIKPTEKTPRNASNASDIESGQENDNDSDIDSDVEENAVNESGNVKDDTIALLEKLYQCARSAEAHHKEHGTFMFWGKGLTKSGLARTLDQIIDSPLTQGIEFSKSLSEQVFLH